MPPLVHQQECPEVEFTGLIMPHQTLDFVPRQPAVDTSGHFSTERGSFDTERVTFHGKHRRVISRILARECRGEFCPSLGLPGKFPPQPFTESGRRPAQPGEEPKGSIVIALRERSQRRQGIGAWGDLLHGCFSWNFMPRKSSPQTTQFSNKARNRSYSGRKSPW